MPLNFDEIIARFETQQAEANAANEKRYGELLAAIQNLGGQVGGTYNEALSEIDTLGDASRQRIARNTAAQQGQAEQDLISRGLANTTIRSSVKRGILDDAELQQQGVDEAVGRQRSSILQGRAGSELNVGGMLASAIEGRNDIGPDLSLLASLLQNAAASDTRPVSAQVPNAPTTPPTGGGIFRGGGGGGAGGGGNATNLLRNAGGGAPGSGATNVFGKDDRFDVNNNPNARVVGADQPVTQPAPMPTTQKSAGASPYDVRLTRGDTGGFLRHLAQNFSGA